MANLKEVRERISSVQSTQQITKAMKMVAAAKLRRAQQAIVDLRPYSNKLNEMLSNILSASDGDVDTVFGIEREVKNVVIVVETSNRGLCGGFNSSVIKAAIKLIEGKYKAVYESGNLTALFIGKKGKELIPKRFPKLNVIDEYAEIVGKEFSFKDSEQIASRLMEGFTEGIYDHIDVVYAQFKNAAVQNFVVEQFLPVEKLEQEEGEVAAKDYIFEPNQEEILTFLVPNILRTQFHKTILDTTASEHGARMTAMDKASENADELLKELKINYNKARQEAITSELSEISGGVAALEN